MCQVEYVRKEHKLKRTKKRKSTEPQMPANRKEAIVNERTPEGSTKGKNKDKGKKENEFISENDMLRVFM